MNNIQAQVKVNNNNLVKNDNPKKEEKKTTGTMIRKGIKSVLIETPVKALYPAAATIVGFKAGMIVAGPFGAVAGGVIGAQAGLKTADKIAEYAGKAFDKAVDQGIEGAKFIAKKVGEGASYLGKVLYARIKKAFEKAAPRQDEEEDVAAEKVEKKLDELKNKMAAQKVEKEAKIDLPDVPKHEIK